jgi:hypothetical protein
MGRRSRVAGTRTHLVSTRARLEVEVRDVHLFEAEGTVHVVLGEDERRSAHVLAVHFSDLVWSLLQLQLSFLGRPHS